MLSPTLISLALRRVAARVRQGGHDVPRADVVGGSQEAGGLSAHLPALGRQLGCVRQFGPCITTEAVALILTLQSTGDRLCHARCYSRRAAR